MSNEVLDAVAKKDADFIEKFVRKLLKLSEDHWAKVTADAYDSGGAFDAYAEAFGEWHRIRQDTLLFEQEILAKIDRSDAKPEEEKVLLNSNLNTRRHWRDVPNKEKVADT